MNQSISCNTATTYQRSLSELSKFRLSKGLSEHWPPSLIEILSFIVHLNLRNISHSTISCYLSGISFYCKINDVDDPTQKFVVRKVLEGVKRSNGRVNDQRLPITLDLLINIIRILPAVCINSYEAILFKASFSLSFYALLRISEFAQSNGQMKHTMSFSDISFPGDCLKLRIPSSKTDQQGLGTYLQIGKQANHDICPVRLMQKFLKSRPQFQGPLFCHFDGKPLTRYQVVSVLKRAITYLGIDENRYSSHSFRIGAATSLSMQGISDDDIMKAGRWKSSAYKGYIRC